MVAKYDFRNFGGLDQVSEPRIQERNFASAVYDAKLWNGALRNWPCPVERCSTGATVETILPFRECNCLTSDAKFHYAWDCQSVVAFTENGGLRLSEDICSGDSCPGDFQCPSTPPQAAADNPPAEVTNGRKQQFKTYEDDGSEVCSDYRIGDPPEPNEDGTPSEPDNIQRDDDPEFTCTDCGFPETSSGADEGCRDSATQRVAYFYTRVYTVGGKTYESAPSPVSEEVDTCGAVTLSGLSSAPGCFSHFNIYRITSGLKMGEETQTPVNNAILWVGSTATNTFTDPMNNLAAKPAPGLLLEYGGAPDDLTWLHKTESGVYVGLSRGQLWYTYPGRINTWRATRRKAIDPDWGNPLAIEVHKDSVYVITDRRPIWYQVNLSESGPRLDRSVYEEELPIASLKSLAHSKVGIHYISYEGLVSLNKGDSRIISSSAWLLDQWRRFDPENAVGAVQGNSYLMSSPVDAFLFEFDDNLFSDNPRSEVTGLSFGDIAIGASAVAADGRKFLWAKAGVVYEWDRSAYPARSHKDQSPIACAKPCCKFFYRSAIEDENRSHTYTWAEVHFGREYASPEVELRIYRIRCGCPELVCRKTVNRCRPFPIRGCRRDEDWYFELEGCGEILSVTFATSATALRGDSGAK